MLECFTTQLVHFDKIYIGYDLADIFLVRERNRRFRIERIINNYAGRVMDREGGGKKGEKEKRLRNRDHFRNCTNRNPGLNTFQTREESETRLLTLLALVDVLRAVDPLVTGGAGASERSIDRACVADRALVAGIRGAGVVEMAQ